MLPIETLLSTTKSLRGPIAAPQQIQQLPVQQQQAPAVAGGSQSGGPESEFVKAIFGSINGQNQPGPAQTPVNAAQGAQQGPALSVALPDLRPPEAQIQPDNGMMLQFILRTLGVI